MNTLSWFLYLADVVYAQVSFLWVLTIAAPIVYLFYRLCVKMWSDTIYSSDEEVVKEKKMQEKLKPYINNWKFLYVPVAVAFFLNFVPSKETFYLIAGSEAMEYVVNTPEAKAILSDIQEVIQLQIEQLKTDDRPATN